MNVAFYLIGAIVVLLLLYGLIAAGIGFLFWAIIGTVLIGLTAAGLRHWLKHNKVARLPANLSDKRLERQATRALRDLERRVETEPEKQRLRH